MEKTSIQQSDERIDCVENETKLEQAEQLLISFFDGSLKNGIINRKLSIEFPKDPKEMRSKKPWEELGNPTKVQLSKKGESPQEKLYERFETDRKLVVAERKYAIAENFVKYLEEVDQEGLKILYKYYYFEYNWDKVAEETGYSKSACQKRRKKLLTKLAENLASLE